MSEKGDTVSPKIRPTLFIALGGTGAEITLRLRRRILSHAWGCADNPVHIDNLSEFPLAQFILYDLDAASSLENVKANASDPLTNLVRFIDEEKLTSTLDINKYFRTDNELDKYPHISEWFPLPFKKLRELGIDHFRLPAVRMFSRLYFCDKYRHLKSMMEGAIGSLLASVTNKPNLERLSLEMEPASLKVVIIASTAGCIGSGSFIDMGYLAKWLSNRQVMGAKVDLCLMLPSGYGDSGHGKTRSEANTYAALMELETCMGNGTEFVKGWSNMECPNLPQRPYDDVFLFDTINIAQKKTVKIEDVFDMVADTLFEDFNPSEFSSRKSRISINMMQWKIVPFSPPIDGRKYGEMKMMYSKAYSAFGQSIINTQLVQQLSEITRGQVNETLLTMLEKMPASERRALFQNCLEMAMPWIEANLEGVWAVNPEQYVCVVGVDSARIFEQKFGDEFKSAIPASIRMPIRKISFFESGVPDKLTCYVELSGIPLTALTKLPNWRESYEEKNKSTPVHIHKDRTLFVHPLAQDEATLARLADHFKLFVQAIVLGVLKPRVDGRKELLYCLRKSGMEYLIGNERLVRMDGLQNDLAELLRRQMMEVLEHLETTAQYAGLIAIYNYYAQGVYPPAILRDGGVDYDVEGFANVMCTILGDETRKMLAEVSDIDPSKLVARLEDNLAIWTDEIEGSETDVYEHEVNKSHMPKRILKSEFFQTGWLEQYIGIMMLEPPPLPEIPLYVAVNGKQAEPFSMSTLYQMVKLGQLTRDSLVWMEGMDNWAAASTVTYISPVFNVAPPLDDKPPPIA